MLGRIPTTFARGLALVDQQQPPAVHLFDDRGSRTMGEFSRFSFILPQRKDMFRKVQFWSAATSQNR